MTVYSLMIMTRVALTDGVFTTDHSFPYGLYLIAHELICGIAMQIL